MISKRIHCEPGNDNYGRLANYIQDADKPQRDFKRTAEYIADHEGEGEKVLHKWHAGCEADDYALAILEVEATQALNTRSQKEKTYHLLISFRPEDEHRLTPEVMEAIEKEFAEALGFQEHQRHCGAHQNTSNLHIHVAYNMIHPVTLNRREPFRDYHKRDRVCRLIEQRFGLVIDNGREPASVPNRRNEKAKAVEAHTQQESFDGYCHRHKDELVGAIQKASSWQAIHDILARRGLALELHGNGCVIKDIHGKHAIKASSLDRSFSKGALTKRFGECQAPQRQKKDAPSQRSRFEARPLQKSPERGALWQQYQQAKRKRNLAMSAIEARHKAELEQVQKDADKTLARIKATALNEVDKEKRLAKHRLEAARKLKTLEKERKAKIAEARKQHPHPTWTGYLKDQAKEGNELALAILRSTKEEVQPEPAPPTNGPETQKAFEAAIQDKQAKLAEASAARKSEATAVHLKWQQHRTRVQDLTRPDKFSLLSDIARRERKELQAVHATYADTRKQIEHTYPFSTLEEFIKCQGQRSRTIGPPEERRKDPRRAVFRAQWQAKRDSIRSRTGLTAPDRKRLMSVSRFEQLADEEITFPKLRRAKIFTGFRYTVDAQGTIIVTLASGALIRDSGKELTFSRHPEAKEAARHIGRMKFGRFTVVEGGVMRSAQLCANFFEQEARKKNSIGAEIAALRAEMPTAFADREKELQGAIDTLSRISSLPTSQQGALATGHIKWLQEEQAKCPAAEKEMWSKRLDSFKSFAREYTKEAGHAR